MNSQQVPKFKTGLGKLLKFLVIATVVLAALATKQQQRVQAHEIEDPDQASSSNNNGDPSGNLDSTGNGNGAGIYQAPESLDVVRLNEKSVVLKWDISHLSLDALKFFKIQYKSTKKPDNNWKTDPRIVASNTKAIQIDNLRAGNYLFIVIAVYDNDDNRPSEPFKYQLRLNSKIPAHDLPEKKAPQIVWSQAEVDQIRFKWSYNPKEKDVSNGYYGYLVYYKSTYQVSDFIIYNTLDESVELAELEPETEYEAKVLAYNENGVSDFSEMLKIKTLAKGESTQQQSASVTTVPTNSLANNSNNKTSSPTVTQLPSQTQTDPPPSMTTSTTTPTTPPAPTTISPTIQTSSPPSSTKHHTIKVDINTPDFSLTNILSWNDTPVIRYSLCVIIFILFILCLMMNCHQRRKEASPTTNQPDLEINGFFKNSFPASPSHNNPPNYCLSYVETA